MDARKVAIVTGASRGIGRAIAVALAGQGYDLAITYKANDEAAAETLRLIDEAGGQGEALKFDVADGPAAEEALKGLLERLPRIDALVNNAGITADGLFLMMPAGTGIGVLATTLNGFYNMTKPVAAQDAPPQGGGHRLHRLGLRPGGEPRAGQLRGSQGRAHRREPHPGGRGGPPRGPGERGGPRGYRYGDAGRGAQEQIKQLIPMGRIGRPKRWPRPWPSSALTTPPTSRAKSSR